MQRHYRGFTVTQADDHSGFYDSDTGLNRHRHFPILYGPEFPSNLRGCPVLPTSGCRTWPESERACDLLVACGFTPQTGKGDVYEFYALSLEVKFRRAFVMNEY